MAIRRHLQFSLRNFLVLLTLFGVWLGFHVRSAKQQEEAVAIVKEFGGTVGYEIQGFDATTGNFNLQPKRWLPKWFQFRLGEDFFHDVEAV